MFRKISTVIKLRNVLLLEIHFFSIIQNSALFSLTHTHTHIYIAIARIVVTVDLCHAYSAANSSFLFALSIKCVEIANFIDRRFMLKYNCISYVLCFYSNVCSQLSTFFSLAPLFASFFLHSFHTTLRFGNKSKRS